MAEEIFPAGTPLEFGTAPFPYLRIPGREAVDAIARLGVMHQDRTPVIWGDDAEAARLFELFNDNAAEPTQPSVALAKAAAATGTALHDAHRAEVRKSIQAYCARLGKPDPFADVDAEDESPPRGAWPEFVERHEQPISLIDHRTRDYKAEVLVGLVPTAKPWEIPAYLAFGNWNDCPPPEVHVAYAREWFDRFGARIVLNSPDTIEYVVERPVSDRETAIDLALAHCSYCGDIVYQGVGTIEALAAHLIGARYWYFWWD